MKKPTAFIFDRYTIDAAGRVATFSYCFDTGVVFTETLEFPATNGPAPDPQLLENALFALHLMLGISYWKLYCPKTIEVRSGRLTADEAAFWNTVYTKGLGEFFYQNKIDFRDLVKFPVSDSENTPRAVSITTNDRALVLLGGGKDSLTTISLLEEMDKRFDSYSMGEFRVIEDQVANLRLPHLRVNRGLSKELFAELEGGAFDGHVPMTAIYGFTALLTSVFSGHAFIVASNERSANEGNVTYLGAEINHQWSKSFEFEKLFSEYIERYVSPDIQFFSMLRPFSEIQIAKLFARHEKYWPVFTSCNRNFSLLRDAKERWCGKCSKCLFVFTMLAPFIPKSALTEMFQSNLFANTSLLPDLRRQLGVESFKPFDCVGTKEEVTVAMIMAHEIGEYDDDPLMRYFVEVMLVTIPNSEGLKQKVFSVSDEHRIPEEFQSFLHEFRE